MSEQVRPPIVTILGHVDHGKTSLLDYIRKASVAAKEHGGITQAIGAYQVEQDGKFITFIDTPGHAAFEKMRSRGAKVADIAVLVVAIDDGIMPQTVEAIKHIKAAGVPMIVAVNKVDLPGIDVRVQMEKLKKQLSDHEVLIEEYGGDVPIVQVSAKVGTGVPELLETILLVAEMNEFKGDPQTQTSGVVIESRLDKFKGATATFLVRNGTLKKSDTVVVGGVKCKVRGLFDYNGKAIESAGPSMPVEVLGWEGVPAVGAAIGEEAQAAKEKQAIQSLLEKLAAKDEAVLNVVLRADKQGSLEAIETALDKFNEDGQHLKILSSGTGEIIDSDVQMASSTGAIVVGFNVEFRPSAKRMAETAGVLVRSYTIIYELLDEIEEVVEGMLKVGALEEVFGVAQILQQFPYGKGERIAGCRVLSGSISKGPKIRVKRGEGENQVVVGEGKIKSIKRNREEVAKVEQGQECGFMFDPVIDFETGDVVESYRVL